MPDRARDDSQHAKHSAKPKVQEVEAQAFESLEPDVVSAPEALQRATPPPPAPLDPTDVLSLQRAAGNMAVGRLMAQRKAMTPHIQRQEEMQEEEDLQLAPEGGGQQIAMSGPSEVAPEVSERIDSAKSQGEALPDDVRQPMEQTLGSDLSEVRVHTDRESDWLSRSLQAKAFTTGQDVFFRSNEYQPDNSSGKRLLAHELTHVVQQRGGKTAGKVQREPGDAPPKPVKYYKLWSQPDSERQKYSESCLMTVKKLKEKGGTTSSWRTSGFFGIKKKTGAKLYKQVVDKVTAYRNLVKQYHAKMEPAPELFQKQQIDLQTLLTTVQRCKAHHKSWKEHKKKTRKDKYELLETLEQQAVQEKTQRLDKIKPWVTAKTLSEHKDDKGERKAGHELELLDPEHRDYNLLTMIYPEWQKRVDSEDTNKEFYAWVDELENTQDEYLLKQLHKRHQMPNARGWGVREKDYGKWKDLFLAQKKQNLEKLIERTWYLKAKTTEVEGESDAPQETYREDFEVVFQGLASTIGGVSIREIGERSYIFTMSPDGRFFAFPESPQTTGFFHHSSFLSGGAVGAAGKIKFESLGITIDPESGHYQPSLQQMVNAVSMLKNRHSVPLDQISVHPWFGCPNEVRGDDFMGGLEQLKAPGAMELMGKLVNSGRSSMRITNIEGWLVKIDEGIMDVENYKGRDRAYILDRFRKKMAGIEANLHLEALSSLSDERYYEMLGTYYRKVLKKELKMLKKTTKYEKTKGQVEKRFGTDWTKNDLLDLVTMPANWPKISPLIRNVIL